MLETENCFTLKGGETWITERSTDAYQVVSGTVLIYVVPLKQGAAGRKSFIHQAGTGEVIPSLTYKDIEYREWRFCLVAVDSAQLKMIENGATRHLKENFAHRAHIKNYDREGFNGGLVDQYRMNIVKEDGFIRRTQHQREDTAGNILQVIARAFRKMPFEKREGNSGNPLYDAMCILCSSQKIRIAPYEKVKEACKNDISVSSIARLSHFAYREIVLDDGWEKEDCGPFLAFRDGRRPVVCMSKGTHSYLLWDVENECILPCTKKVADTFDGRGYMLYCPLPDKSLTKRDIVSYCTGRIRKADAASLILLTIVTALIGILIPMISQKIYDEYIPLGAKSILFQIGSLLASFMIANVLFSIIKNIAAFRISSKIAYDMQGAVYNRLFNLPESFFRKYESADLAQRVMTTEGMVNNISNIVISSGIAVIFVIVNFIRMAVYSWKLALIGLLMVAIYSGLYYLVAGAALKHRKQAIALGGKTGSLMFQLLNGISKIRIAGAEDLAIYEYIKPYVRQSSEEEKDSKISKFGALFHLAANSIFSIVFYILIIKADFNISLGAFVAFNSLFGGFSAYILQLADNAVTLRGEKPNIERLQPVLEAQPELDDSGELPGDISGSIEISNVFFAYDKDLPPVLDGITLNIKAGEYVGIVGSSGCGKSTLLKLLLGFEKPLAGKIYYDNKDIESLDKRELRKKMGVVLQNGKLISGSIFENITITAPAATTKDVHEVIEQVGLTEDIREMPMGLHTILSEDCNTISGGQQQRILIARAIISKPKILFFDEATSALDNVTQSKVCETIRNMDATRVIIAHRLSTVIRCDRIIVLDKGKIAEQGTFEELMKHKGLFYQLAGRQMA